MDLDWHFLQAKTTWLQADPYLLNVQLAIDQPRNLYMRIAEPFKEL